MAEELWEVKDKTIKNLSRVDMTIVDYKKNLVKQSKSLPCRLRENDRLRMCAVGEAALEKAKLISKNVQKGKT